jgi:hypothetical protein
LAMCVWIARNIEIIFSGQYSWLAISTPIRKRVCLPCVLA